MTGAGTTERSPPRRERSRKAKPAASPEAPRPRERVSTGGGRQGRDWMDEVLESCGSVEGFSMQWRSDAQQALADAWPSACDPTPAQVVPRLLRFHSAPGVCLNATWAMAVCREVWRSLEVSQDGVRVPMGAHLGVAPSPKVFDVPGGDREPEPQVLIADAMTAMRSEMQTQMREQAQAMRAEMTAQMRELWGQRDAAGQEPQRGPAGAGALAPVVETNKNQNQLKDTAAAARVDAIKRRLKWESERSACAFENCLDDFAHDEMWPWANTTRETRMAPDYLAYLNRGGRRAPDVIKQWFTDNGFSMTEELDACEQLYMLATLLDHLLLRDKLSVCNSTACEMIVRRMFGIQKSLKNKKDKDGKQVVSQQWRWTDLVHFTPGMGGIDEEVRKEMQAAAEIAKWSAKAEAAPGSGLAASAGL